MNNSIFHKLSSVLWVLIVCFIVLLAVYVSLGRMLTSLTGSYQKEILQELNARVPFTLDAQSVAAEWHSFTPVMILRGLRLTFPGGSGRPIVLSEGRIGLDMIGTLRTLTPQMTHFELAGLQLAGELNEQGQLHIKGIEGGDTELSGWLEHFLLNLEWVAVEGAQLDLSLPTGEHRGLELDLQMSRERSQRQIEASLQSTRGLQVSALATGVGNPFAPDSFTGELYLDVETSDLGATRQLLAHAMPGIGVEGSRLAVQLWSGWDRGVPSAEARFEVRDLLVAAADQSWQVPLDRVAFEASLVERREKWGLFVSGLELAVDDTSLQIPRLQLNLRGETLRIRAVDIPLEPLGEIVSGIDSIGPAAADVIRVLRPAGIVPSMQLGISDIDLPLQGWDLSANFEQLAVNSWLGAPGVSGAQGYVELAPGGGSVVLDSHQFSMNFPTVYHQPLRYEDFHGTINIDWNAEAVRLASGLIRARGLEGSVPVLFGLSIPLVATDVGLEMDLLVGLEGTPVNHRAKYIPYLLPDALREWLAGGLGEGMIAQGGFLWRGSLQATAPQLHTVQLFFNVEDAVLDYHSGWPPLANVDGIVLIDDVDVSVWADSARILESDFEQLSVEFWSDPVAGQQLAIDGRLVGPAADGLQVVNGSDLTELAGPAFSQWRLSGDLHTDLKLALNLSDESVPPRVDLSARFTGVDLDIVPGQLPIRNISGKLNYDTARGFSSTGLRGELWGQPLTGTLGQREATELPDGTGQAAAVVIDIASVVGMDDVRQWLDLELLAFARGQAAVDARLVAAAGDPVSLSLDTNLAGISLDLPAPWGKAAEEIRQLHLDISPGEESLGLGLGLEGGLQSRLALVGGDLRAGVLAFAEPPPELADGSLHISGRMAYADVDEWRRVLGAYFVPEAMVAPGQGSEPESGAGAVAVAESGAVAGSEETSPSLAINIDELQVERLVAGDTEFDNVEFSLAGADAHWLLMAKTDWVQGEWRSGVDGAPSRLDIDRLDLAGLTDLKLADGESRTNLELPLVAVTVGDLRRADHSLGSLNFDLHASEGVLQASNIGGNIAGLQFHSGAPGQLLWRQGEGGSTEIRASLHFEDLGQTLNHIGYEEIIETEEGEFDLALAWPGGPEAFSLAQAEGALGVNIGRGRFLDAPTGASGALHVVSILNLAEIVQRLSLTHMFESGIPFNQLDGNVVLQAGTIEVADMNVQGSASSFQFSGKSVVDSRSLDGELIVTLPVANNLPWVAALTAGLPVAAGVFLLSKVFEKQVNRLASAVYSTTGTWDDPQVEFQRIFDNTSPEVVSELEGAVDAAAPAPEQPKPDQAESP